METRKTPKHWRIHPHYLDRMKRLLLPHQTETDFVEQAIYEKVLREEDSKVKVGA
jgi:hypothetical protein